MPKFDFIIQNPPYKSQLHLQFLEKSFDDVLNENGQMIIIEPAMFLLDIRNKNNKISSLKKKLNPYIQSIIIENFNNEFNINLQMPCSILKIDKSKLNNDNIQLSVFGHKKYVKNIFDCNHVGNIDLIHSIFQKVKHSKYLSVSTRITNEDIENVYYATCAKIMRGGCGDPRFSDEWFVNDLYRCYFYHCYNDKMSVSSTRHKLLQTGYTYKNPIFKDEYAINIYGSKTELQNYKNFIFNNSLAKFINIAIIINMNNNNILEYIPFVNDGQYSDTEINAIFGFNEKEIELINTTIKKYNRNSPFWKRYITGDTSIEINQEKPWE